MTEHGAVAVSFLEQSNQPYSALSLNHALPKRCSFRQQGVSSQCGYLACLRVVMLRSTLGFQNNIPIGFIRQYECVEWLFSAGQVTLWFHTCKKDGATVVVASSTANQRIESLLAVAGDAGIGFSEQCTLPMDHHVHHKEARTTNIASSIPMMTQLAYTGIGSFRTMYFTNGSSHTTYHQHSELYFNDDAACKLQTLQRRPQN